MKKPPTLPGEKPPTSPPDDTQPRRPEIIPPPPGSAPAPSVVRRRILRRKREAWWGTLALILLLSLVILLGGLVVLLIVTPEYFDPYIPGRLETRTAEAAVIMATDAAFATREAGFAATQQQAALNADATATAVEVAAVQRATRSALDANSTASALVQTATGAAVAFDATRTSVALAAQGTAAAGTQAALEQQAATSAAAGTDAAGTRTAIAQQFEQQSITREAAGTAAALTATAQDPGDILPQSGSEPQPGTIPTADASRFNVYFADDFENGLDAAWTVNGNWRTEAGDAFATICGTSLEVGDPAWDNFAVEVDVENPAAQFAVITGYGEAGRLYVNFGRGGTVWWLVENAPAITDNTVSRAYDPTQVNLVRVTVQERVVAVTVDDILISERLLPEAARGRVGLYTCPAGGAIPRFGGFRVVRIP